MAHLSLADLSRFETPQFSIFLKTFNVSGTSKIFYMMLNTAILLFSNTLPLILSKYTLFYRVKMFLQ